MTAPPIQELITRLRRTYPNVHCELNYGTPWQLLVATILSAQCTDERVNQVTPALFAAYPTPAATAAAPRAALEELIRPTGFFRQKARFIQETAQALLQRYGGEVPDSMEALLTLTGVARKTANVVLGEVYGRPEGIAVDTHVKRLAKRLGLTIESDPVKVERDLMALVPRESWVEISHLLIFHGRHVCFARSPNCAACPLLDICPTGSA